MGTTADKLQHLINGKQAVVNSVNNKASTSYTINSKWSDIAISIDNISTGTNTSDATAIASDVLQGKTAYNASGKITGTITNYSGEHTDGAEEGTAGIVPTGTLTVTQVGTYDVTNYASAIFSVSTETKTVTPSASSQSITPSSGKYLSNVTVNPIPSNYIIPSGTKSITSNGTSIDVTSYKYVNVNVASSGGTTSETFKLLITKYPSGGSGPSPWDMRAVVKPTSTYYVYFDTPIIQNGVTVFPGIDASDKQMLQLSESDLTNGVEVELPMYSAYIVGVGDGLGNSITISFMQGTTTNMRTVSDVSDFGTVDSVMVIPCTNYYTNDTLYVHI